MKIFQKFFSLIFATLIFASQSGMAFNIHYCKGVLASVTIGDAQETCAMESYLDTPKKCCFEKNSDSHEKCCKDSNIDLKKISNDEVISKTFNFELSAFTATESTKVNILVASLFQDVEPTKFCFTHFASNAPPFYKLYCKYILYA